MRINQVSCITIVGSYYEIYTNALLFTYVWFVDEHEDYHHQKGSGDGDSDDGDGGGGGLGQMSIVGSQPLLTY